MKTLAAEASGQSWKSPIAWASSPMPSGGTPRPRATVPVTPCSASREMPSVLADLGYCYFLQGQADQGGKRAGQSDDARANEPAVLEQPGPGRRPSGPVRGGPRAFPQGRLRGRRPVQPGVSSMPPRNQADEAQELLPGGPGRRSDASPSRARRWRRSRNTSGCRKHLRKIEDAGRQRRAVCALRRRRRRRRAAQSRQAGVGRQPLPTSCNVEPATRALLQSNRGACSTATWPSQRADESPIE